MTDQRTFDHTYVGSIGVAMRSHWLECYHPGIRWATSQCGKWAGQVMITKGQPTCLQCRALKNVIFTKDARYAEKRLEHHALDPLDATTEMPLLRKPRRNH